MELTLRARTAQDLMTSNPVSISHKSLVSDAARCLLRRSISAAPVIDEAGRPLGVVSRTDLLAQYPNALADHTSVLELLTPRIYCVRHNATPREVIDTMTKLNIRRLFVVDDSDILIGVISAWDVLRHLRKPRRRVK